MTKIPSLKLRIANNVEKGRSWEGINTPDDFARFLASILSVDASQIQTLEEIIPSGIAPTGDNSKKIWIKNEAPFGIGIPIGGTYHMIYRHPPNIPLLWTQGDSELPSWMTKLTDEELIEMSLTAPSNTSYYYVIFRE